MVPVSELMDENGEDPSDADEEDYTEDYIAIPLWEAVR